MTDDESLRNEVQRRLAAFDERAAKREKGEAVVLPAPPTREQMRERLAALGEVEDESPTDLAALLDGPRITEPLIVPLREQRIRDADQAEALITAALDSIEPDIRDAVFDRVWTRLWSERDA